VFNIEVFNTCQMPLDRQKSFFFGGTSQKCPPVTVKAYPKIACHKIQGDVEVPPHELIGVSDPGGDNPPANILPPPGIIF
jgi:hypothetical protein